MKRKIEIFIDAVIDCDEKEIDEKLKNIDEYFTTNVVDIDGVGITITNCFSLEDPSN